jgi:hypothetical protein
VAGGVAVGIAVWRRAGEPGLSVTPSGVASCATVANTITSAATNARADHSGTRSRVAIGRAVGTSIVAASSRI